MIFAKYTSWHLRNVSGLDKKIFVEGINSLIKWKYVQVLVRISCYLKVFI